MLKRFAIVFLSVILAALHAVEYLVSTTLPSVDVLPLLKKPDLPVAARLILMQNYRELAAEVLNTNVTLIFIQPRVMFSPFRSEISLEFGVRCLNGLSYQGERPLRIYSQSVRGMLSYKPIFMVRGPNDISTDAIDQWYSKPTFTSRVYNLAWMRSELNILLMLLFLTILVSALIPKSSMEPCLFSARFTLIVFLLGVRVCNCFLYLDASSEIASADFMLQIFQHFVILVYMIVYIYLCLILSLEDLLGGLEAGGIWEVIHSRWIKMEDLPPYESGYDAGAAV